MAGMRLGVEVGGTFTDLVLFEEGPEGGRMRVEKVPSTPRAPEEGAMAAIRAAGVDLARVVDLVHGSTVATNAVLERKGARVLLLVTEGTRDLLYLQRHDRRHIYDLYYRKPEPVVARRDTLEIPERLGPDGAVVDPLDAGRARARIRAHLASPPPDPAGRGRPFEAVCICLLNSYANPAHEQALARVVGSVLEELGLALPVTLSSEVCRVFREYERCSTTALSAYVSPGVGGYLERLAATLARDGYRGRLTIMQSNGGRLPADAMRRSALSSLFSGPAAGVMGAIRQGERSGARDLITFDMGGTSTDVCLVENGQPHRTGETEVDGLPIRMPVIDIATVGAGGGSICWVDDGGLLRVGPRSAGADPGPACYGWGGTEPTVTDAHLIRGTLPPESFLGGRMRVDPAAARRAFAPVASALGLGLEEAAASAIALAEASVVRAIQRISTERGKDPRDYVLLPYGGAGPLHAARIAEDLGIDRVLIPPHPGVLSAYGLLAADFVHYETLSRPTRVGEETMAEIRGALRELEEAGAAFLASLGLEGPPLFEHTLEMRYATQAFEIPVRLPPGAAPGLDAPGLMAAFEAAHEAIFEFAEGGGRSADVISYRVGAAVAPGPVPPLAAGGAAQAAAAPGRPVVVHEGGAAVQALALSRASLAGPRPGPLLIEDGTATAWVPPGWTAALDEAGSVRLERDRGRGEPEGGPIPPGAARGRPPSPPPGRR